MKATFNPEIKAVLAVEAVSAAEPTITVVFSLVEASDLRRQLNNTPIQLCDSMLGFYQLLGSILLARNKPL